MSQMFAYWKIRREDGGAELPFQRLDCYPPAAYAAWCFSINLTSAVGPPVADLRAPKKNPARAVYDLSSFIKSVIYRRMPGSFFRFPCISRNPLKGSDNSALSLDSHVTGGGGSWLSRSDRIS